MAALRTEKVKLPCNQRIKDGRIFVVSKRAKSGEIYLRCSTNFCFGTAKKLRNGDIKMLRNHSDTCFTDHNVQLKADFKEALKSALEQKYWRLKQVYETVASTFPGEIKIEVPFNEILSSLRRWRKRFSPPCTETLQSMTDQVEQPPQAFEDVSLDGIPPPLSPPTRLPEASVGPNKVSKSRKKNLRKKRRRQMKAQLGVVEAQPHGHNRRAKKRKKNPQGPKCVVCLDNIVTHAFIPCGHNCSCLRCATTLGLDEIKRCPKCGAHFTQFIAIYNEPA